MQENRSQEDAHDFRIRSADSSRGVINRKRIARRDARGLGCQTDEGCTRGLSGHALGTA